MLKNLGKAMALILCLVSHMQTMPQTELVIPQFAVIGRPVYLRCLFDDNDETVSHLSWLKDGVKFYQIYRGAIPYSTYSPIDGITLDLNDGNETTVLLIDVSLNTAGLFSCIIDVESPSQLTLVMQQHMGVVESSDQNPCISEQQVECDCPKNRDNEDDHYYHSSKYLFWREGLIRTKV